MLRREHDLVAKWAATDKANKQMRQNGRTKWNEDDYNLASETYAQLIGGNNATPDK